MSRRALLCFLTLAAGASPLYGQLTRGPYLQMGTPTSIVVRWRTSDANEGVVRYGTDSASLSLMESEGGSTTEHVVSLSGLSPDTKYYYSIGTPSSTLAGDETFYFVTAPLPGSVDPIRIWILGDSGTKDANARAVRDGYLERPDTGHTNVWLMLGDNAYPNGTDPQYQAAVFDVYGETLKTTVLWPTLGNHDGHSADSASQSGPYYDIFTLPTAAEAGGVPSGTEAYFSFDYGNVHFINLESFETNRSVSGAMATWLLADLQLNDKDWVIAYWHHPPYTKGSHDSDTENIHIQMRENFLPVLEQYGVDLVLGGHSHSYERSYLLDGHYGFSSTFVPSMKIDGGDGRETGDGAYTKSPVVAASHEGAVYAVAGSSGQVSNGPLNHPAMFISLLSLGSMVVDVVDNRLDGTFLNENGDILDSFTIVKGVDVTPPTLIEVRADGDPTEVRVWFSTTVDPVSAAAPSNYAIDNGIAVLGAVLESDGRSVTLTTSPLTPGAVYTLTVNGVTDIPGNPIAPDSQMPFEYMDLVAESFQDGVSPQPSYFGTRDTYISENAADTNFGSGSLLIVDGLDAGGDLATLLKWDVSQIPPFARVQSVEITLSIQNPTNHAYEIYGLKRDWLESEATWNEPESAVSWELPGARGPVDRDASVLGAVSGPLGARTFALNASGVALVQSWVGNPASNFGVIIANTSSTDGLDFFSRDAATASDRPRLAITYDQSLTSAGCTAPSALALENVTVDYAVTCEAGTVLEAGPSFHIGSGGDVIFRAGENVSLRNGFTVASGAAFTVETDPSLVP